MVKKKKRKQGDKRTGSDHNDLSLKKLITTVIKG